MGERLVPKSEASWRPHTYIHPYSCTLYPLASALWDCWGTIGHACCLTSGCRTGSAQKECVVSVTGRNVCCATDSRMVGGKIWPIRHISTGGHSKKSQPTRTSHICCCSWWDPYCHLSDRRRGGDTVLYSKALLEWPGVTVPTPLPSCERPPWHRHWPLPLTTTNHDTRRGNAKSTLSHGIDCPGVRILLMLRMGEGFIRMMTQARNIKSPFIMAESYSGHRCPKIGHGSQHHTYGDV